MARSTQVRKPSVSHIDQILDERAASYGTFEDGATIAQKFKYIMREAGALEKFDPDQVEALEIIFSKVARLLNGDNNHVDSWDDIQGYAKLISDRLRGKSR